MPRRYEKEWERLQYLGLDPAVTSPERYEKLVGTGLLVAEDYASAVSSRFPVLRAFLCLAEELYSFLLFLIECIARPAINNAEPEIIKNS